MSWITFRVKGYNPEELKNKAKNAGFKNRSDLMNTLVLQFLHGDTNGDKEAIKLLIEIFNKNVYKLDINFLSKEERDQLLDFVNKIGETQ